MSYAEICWNALNVWQVTGLWPLQLQVRSGAASSKSIDIQNPRWNRSLLQLRLLRLLLCNSLTNSCNCGLDLIWHHTRRAGAASKSEYWSWAFAQCHRSVKTWNCTVQISQSVRLTCRERCSWIEHVSEQIAQYNVIQYKKKKAWTDYNCLTGCFWSVMSYSWLFEIQ